MRVPVTNDGIASPGSYAMASHLETCGHDALVVAPNEDMSGASASPDRVVSGINSGLNTGPLVLHSGTVGAALTAQNFGASAIAVRLESSDPWRWDTACAFAGDLAEQVS